MILDLIMLLMAALLNRVVSVRLRMIAEEEEIGNEQLLQFIILITAIYIPIKTIVILVTYFN